MNYKESKKKLDAIRSKYSCAGDLIFRTAIMNLMKWGTQQVLSDGFLEKAYQDIDNRHAEAEAQDKLMFCTRDFERALVECTHDIAEINTSDILMYVQREVWMDDGINDISYDRALDIIKYCIEDGTDYGGFDSEMTKIYFDRISLDESEAMQLGYGYVYDNESEEE